MLRKLEVKIAGTMHTEISRIRICSAQGICEAKLEVMDLLSEVEGRWPRNIKPEQKAEFLEAFRDLNDVRNLDALIAQTAVLKQKAISDLVAEAQKDGKPLLKNS